MKAWLLSLHKTFILAHNFYKNRAKMGKNML